MSMAPLQLAQAGIWKGDPNPWQMPGRREGTGDLKTLLELYH